MPLSPKSIISLLGLHSYDLWRGEFNWKHLRYPLGLAVEKEVLGTYSICARAPGRGESGLRYLATILSLVQADTDDVDFDHVRKSENG